MKTLKIYSDCHIKNADLSNEAPFSKSIVLFFRRTYAFSVGFKMKPLRKSVFLCYGKSQLKLCKHRKKVRSSQALFQHSLKKWKDSLETRTELAVLRTYVENQAILEPILLYRASKCKQTKEESNKDCLWTHVVFFL